MSTGINYAWDQDRVQNWQVTSVYVQLMHTMHVTVAWQFVINEYVR